ncbi:hypothetical protein Tco_0666461 [Tanacetum coccineum]
MIEQLNILVIPVKFYARLEAVPREPPTLLVDLKYICLEGMCFNVNKKPELEFVKLILAKSLTFKKVSILLKRNVAVNKDLKMLKILRKSPRASPMADINVDRLPIKKRRSIGFVI